MGDNSAAANTTPLGTQQEQKQERQQQKTMKRFTGSIVRRRCLGRFLAFADIRLLVATSTGASATTPEHPQPSANNTPDAKDEQEDNNDDEDKVSNKNNPRGEVISVIFRRQWVMTAEFPTKKAALPFDAQIQVVCRRNLVPNQGGEHDFDENTDRSNSKEEEQLWMVVEWKLLTNPRQQALELALLERPTKQQQLTPDGTSCGVFTAGDGGVSSSKYLQIRHQAHQAATAATTQSKLAASNRTRPNNSSKKSKRQEVPLPPKSSSTEASFLEIPHKLDEHNNKCDSHNETEGGHGRSSSHGLGNPPHSNTYRVMAQWMVKYILQMDGTDRVLDVAGGKGKLASELAMAGIACTVMEPVQRKTPLSKGLLKRLRKQGKPIPQFVTGYFLAPRRSIGCDQEENGPQEPRSTNILSDQSPHVTTTTTTTNHSSTSNTRTSSFPSSVPPSSTSLSYLSLWSDEGIREHVKRTRALVESHTCLVGLHADQCTEDILTVVLEQHKRQLQEEEQQPTPNLHKNNDNSNEHNNKNNGGRPRLLSVAIVPCCVFPDLFATRRLHNNGQVVRSYQDFIQYLLEKEDHYNISDRDNLASITTTDLQPKRLHEQSLVQPPLLDPSPQVPQEQQQRPRRRRLQTVALPFAGKNLCIYYKAERTTQSKDIFKPSARSGSPMRMERLPPPLS